MQGQPEITYMVVEVRVQECNDGCPVLVCPLVVQNSSCGMILAVLLGYLLWFLTIFSTLFLSLHVDSLSYSIAFQQVTFLLK